MDDEEIYGDTFTHMSFKEAIETGLLTDYKVVTIDIQKSEIASFIQENNLVQLNDKWKKETEARSLASMLALRKAMKVLPIKNAVSFHSSIEKAVRNKELQQYITETYHYKPIDTFTVSGKQPTTQRNIVVQEFASSPNSLITNARCLTEGVDVPNIDCIVFSDPRKSKVDIVQALGRALRKKEGKEWGYVILPVIYDDITHEIDNENFQEILAVVRGLASNDERIVEYFKDKADPNSTSKPTESQFHLEVFSEYIDEAELSSQLQIKLWEKLSRFSWMPFEEAREYVRGLQIKNQFEWRAFSNSKNRPLDIPANPMVVYISQGWVNMGDWLGTFNIRNSDKSYRNFSDAREFARSLKFKKIEQWTNYCKSGKKPIDIPSVPSRPYKNEGWINWADWLGKDSFQGNSQKLTYLEARKIVQKFRLQSTKDWADFCKSGKKPSNIPNRPSAVYKDNGWNGWGDWLGTKTIANFNKTYMPIEQLKQLVRVKNIKTQLQWHQFYKNLPSKDNIPSNPQRTYKEKGWINWADFLGKSENNKK
ncbi:MAG: hypothetical protein RJA76_1412, partial [Bacteroidota bacterium]|jgi:superfamily II DNA/RNA helicase